MGVHRTCAWATAIELTAASFAIERFFVSGTDDERKLAVARKYIQLYNAAIEKLVPEFNSQLRGTDTRFVLQPFAIQTDLAEREWISQADCFHPSAEGQAFISRGIWDNLLQVRRVCRPPPPMSPLLYTRAAPTESGGL